MSRARLILRKKNCSICNVKPREKNKKSQNASLMQKKITMTKKEDEILSQNPEKLATCVRMNLNRTIIVMKQDIFRKIKEQKIIILFA